MQIDPRTMKQLLEYQLMNSIDLQGTALQGISQSENSASAFGELLSQMLSRAGITDVSNMDNTTLSSLSTDSSSAGNPLWYNILSSNGDQSAVNSVGAELESDFHITNSSTKPTQYEDLIQAASQKYGVPESLIKAVIDTESSFRPDAVSSVGAKGLMQLMDGTAQGLGVSDSLDPAQNIDGGVRYLSYQLKRYGGEMKMALAAYNAGPSKVNALDVANDAELTQQLHKLPTETQAYIGKIERAMTKYEAV